MPADESVVRTAESTAANVFPRPRRATNTPSHPGARWGRASRTDCRINRFRRFLPTARLSTLAGTSTAKRLGRFPKGRFLYIKDTPSAFTLRPRRMTDAMSGDGSLLGRGNMLHSQSPSSGESSALEHLSSDAGRHAGAEPVGAGSFLLLGLIHAFGHRVSIPDTCLFRQEVCMPRRAGRMRRVIDNHHQRPVVWIAWLTDTTRSSCPWADRSCTRREALTLHFLPDSTHLSADRSPPKRGDFLSSWAGERSCGSIATRPSPQATRL